MEWSGLEILVRGEFKSRAPMHLGTSAPPLGELNWLAYMQHYGVPTRLLDFTYSPFVGTYFALREHSQRRCAGVGHVRLWAVDVAAVTRRFVRVAGRATAEERKRKRRATRRAAERRAAVSFHPDDLSTARDRVAAETEGMQGLVSAALTVTEMSRTVLNAGGCVCAAMPSEFNPRLASQQGLFLFNCAEKLSFRESLARMMGDARGWCKVFDISRAALGEIEENLFQMNVHEQSLFPDMTGLAGVVRQRIRLHWK